MSTYTTQTSDCKRALAFRYWKLGAFGFLGLENFYVGKIKNGVIHCLIGGIVLIFNIAGYISVLPDVDTFSEVLSYILMGVFVFGFTWLFCGLPNLIKILLGTFRDNVGSPVRE